jgi:tetratricopeptide (TPR) repeat protein
VSEILDQVKFQQPVAPRQLQPNVPPDLEAICLKCLHKRPERRYGTAEALAEDLRRFRADEPVVARTWGRLERLWRWRRRNPAVAALLAAVGLSLLLGTGVAIWFAVDAQANAVRADQARQQAEQLARKEKEAHGRAEQARVRAEALLALLERTIGDTTEFFANDRVLQAFPEQRREILRRNAGILMELKAREGISPLSVARTWNVLGVVHYRLGENQKAQEAWQTAAEILAALPERTEQQAALALATMRLGALLGQQAGPKAKREGTLRTGQAKKILLNLIRKDAERAEYHYRLSMCYANEALTYSPWEAAAKVQKVFCDAVASADHAVSRDPTAERYRIWAARCRSNLGLFLERSNAEKAIHEHRAAVDRARALVNDFPDSLEALDCRTVCLLNLGRVLGSATGRKNHDEAMQCARQAEGDYLALVGRCPTDPDFRWGVAMARTNLGKLLSDQEQWQQAADKFHQAAEGFRRLIQTHPDLTLKSEFGFHFAICLGHLTSTARRLQREKETAAYLGKLHHELLHRRDYPATGASTVGLMSSLHGTGPMLAVSALFPGRTDQHQGLRALARQVERFLQH